MRASQNDYSRIPLTITLQPATYNFVESCALRQEFHSIDELFEAALTIYKNHLDAIDAYVEMQEARGLSMDEILRTTKPEIVFTRRRRHKRQS